jgi:hypothetical protein
VANSSSLYLRPGSTRSCSLETPGSGRFCMLWDNEYMQLRSSYIYPQLITHLYQGLVKVLTALRLQLQNILVKVGPENCHVRSFPNKSKALSMIVDAPWYVPNTVIRRHLQIPTVKEEIRLYSSQCSARLNAHTNDLTVNLVQLPDNRRLRRHLPNDLSTRFLV